MHHALLYQRMNPLGRAPDLQRSDGVGDQNISSPWHPVANQTRYAEPAYHA